MYWQMKCVRSVIYNDFSLHPNAQSWKKTRWVGVGESLNLAFCRTKSQPCCIYKAKEPKEWHKVSKKKKKSKHIGVLLLARQKFKNLLAKTLIDGPYFKEREFICVYKT